MDAPDHDLQVACRPSLAHDGDVAFDAERLLPSPSALWVLYVHSDQPVVRIHQVVPEPLGHALHSSGALGLLFTDRVTSVQLHVAAGDAGRQRWRFWVDDEPDVTEAASSESLGVAAALTPMGRVNMTTAEIYQRPDDYDVEQACAADDTRFYGHVLRRLHPVRVLELACGTGRVLSALTAALPTAELVGVDASPDMLAQAERRLAGLAPAARDRVTLIEGDMRGWTGEGAGFDAVLIGCCSVSHLLTLEDRRRTWSRVFECLKPGGHFLMDVKMPDLATLAESQRIAPRALVQLDVDAPRRTTAGDARLLRCTATMYDPQTQRADVRFLYDTFEGGAETDRFVSDFPSHVYFPSELELLFATAGFELVQQFGDYGFVPFGRISPYLISLARRP